MLDQCMFLELKESKSIGDKDQFFIAIQQAERDDQDLGQAKAAGRQEEILAICRLHGFSGIPTTENKLKALDMELQDLKQQGQSAKAEYVQTLFLWLSKKVGKVLMLLFLNQALVTFIVDYVQYELYAFTIKDASIIICPNKVMLPTF